MVSNIESKVLNNLLDSYEKSKTFIGENKNQQSFKVSISKLFKKYDDDSEYDFYKDVNNSLYFLESKGLIGLQKEKSGKILFAFLNLDNLERCYDFIGRKSKLDINNNLKELFSKYDNCKKEEKYLPLNNYLEEQKKNILVNKNVKFFDGDFTEFKDVLRLTKAVLENEDEVFVRELSVKLFNNSKRLEAIESKVRGLLYHYGFYDDKDTVLEEHNIINTPTYVMVKGKGILDCGQLIDLAKIGGDIGLSTKTLEDLKSVKISGADVITIENLTNFHKYEPENELVIYLGGFHNQVKRNFIKLVYKDNPDVKYKHYGDIDAGGFYILEHLIDKTGVPFVPYKMDIETLKGNHKHWIELTENDKKRLDDLKMKTNKYSDVIDFMLENNCKLEQEAEFIR